MHAHLTARDCLPGGHWVDAGYPGAAQIVAARTEYGIALHGAVAASTSTQVGTGGGYDQEAFSIDRAEKKVTCPGGATNTHMERPALPAGTARDPGAVLHA
ncbi:hypothetical protein E0500_042770 [Streptomyces sp. KM273126]|uniref:hypothetical protein n=1 Tax=Streptomyces sp. KM273126 TaxID=2545247 RepID=UPI00103D6058|nr:hypothetical protein [Streptomyces sp. KM273126]MBA2813858.1 hypothetical protein [Streptomyces sp. KM273126]